MEAICTDLKLVQVARHAEQTRVQQHIEKIDAELEKRLAAVRAEGAEESLRRIEAVKEAGALKFVQCVKGRGKHKGVDNPRELERDWGYDNYSLQGVCMRCIELLGVR